MNLSVEEIKSKISELEKGSVAKRLAAKKWESILSKRILEKFVK